MMLALLLVAGAALTGPSPPAVPWSRVLSLDEGLVREVRVWFRAPGEATVEILHDGERIDLKTIELDVPLTPARIVLRDADAVALDCVRAISPGWPASRALSWARKPDAMLADDALVRAMPDWKGGGALVWYFDDLLVIARVVEGRVVELHEVFEPGTVELRQQAERARNELDRSLRRIQTRRGD